MNSTNRPFDHSAGARRVAAARALQQVPFLASLPSSSRPRPALSVLAACLLLAQTARAQDDSAVLTPSPRLKPAPSTDAARREAPVYLRADELSGQPNAEVQAQGRVELRHAGVVLRADQLRYDQAEDLAVAPHGDAVCLREVARGRARVLTFGPGGDADVQKDAGPNRDKRRLFLLGFWRSED